MALRLLCQVHGCCGWDPQQLSFGSTSSFYAKNKDGSYKFPDLEKVTVEIQHAIRLFGRIPHVFELRGTKLGSS